MAALRTPGQPCRNQADRWKRVRPEFAARLEAVKARWRIPGRKPRVYDEATADRIILTLNNGVLLR